MLQDRRNALSCLVNFHFTGAFFASSEAWVVLFFLGSSFMVIPLLGGFLLVNDARGI